MKRALAWLAGLAALVSCGPAPSSHPPLPRAGARSVGSATTATTASPDPLGPRPATPAAAPFAPPAPVVYTATNGITVWLLERHSLPMVSLTMVVPSGAASDPAGKEGLALAAANMLDEGAGSRGALELARAIDTLGATLDTAADVDSSSASLTVLKRNLAAGFAILGDVVARPRFEPREWTRIHELWVNDLKARASDPTATARVLYRAALFGKSHPYGHPSDGTIAAAQRVTLADAKSFYATHWRPDRATIVAVGDVTKEELAPLLEQAFASWKAPKSPPLPALAPEAPAGPFPRVVIIDRPDAPQAIVAVLRLGVAARDKDEAPLGRVNTAIGGGFTSRLNQDLREEQHLSYGASSRVAFSRGTGMIVASASVQIDKLTEALKALLADLDLFAKRGLTVDEVDKTRSQARAALVTAFETVDGAASHFARDAALGLGPDYEATAALRRDAATKVELDALAAKYFDPKDAIICIVGPRAKIDLSSLGLPAPQLRDADGNVVTAQ